VPVTPAQFRAAFPAFRNVADGVIQPKLDEAYLRTGDSWGELRDAGARWLTAHLVSTDPLAEPSSKSVKGSMGRTVYLDEWERMLRMTRVWGSAVTVPSYPEAGD
jgi:Protein of unknown function (DUF4054)